MAGYNLKEGTYEARGASDDELWSAFSYAFSSQAVHDTSYKFGFLKAIIDNLYNVDENLTLTFDQLFSKFGEIYWNLVLKHGLRQKSKTYDNRQTALERVLYDARDRYQITEPIPYESLTPAMMADISHRIKVRCKVNVVGAFYEDTKRLFYSFDRTDEWLQINPVMYEFICKHKTVIETLNYYEWARFLERVNDDDVVLRLYDKIDESAKRNNLSIYRRILYEEFEMRTCFYCGRPLEPQFIHVDHFIPWSFIKDDNLWNLVLACPTCNVKKSDRLPADNYLGNIIIRNHQLIAAQHERMRNYKDSKLTNIYNWARVNGYNTIWTPPGRRGTA